MQVLLIINYTSVTTQMSKIYGCSGIIFNNYRSGYIMMREQNINLTRKKSQDIAEMLAITFPADWEIQYTDRKP